MLDRSSITVLASSESLPTLSLKTHLDIAFANMRFLLPNLAFTGIALADFYFGSYGGT